MDFAKKTPEMQLMILSILLSFVVVGGQDCTTSQDNPSSVICTNLTVYRPNASNLTELSIIDSYLTEMPDLTNHTRLLIVRLEHNQIELITRNYSTIEYLSLAWNRICALHQTNLAFPKLEHLDLSHNPIEHITQEYFSSRQFPRLKILKLVNAFKDINPYIVHDRFVPFSSLTYLTEIDLDDNNFDNFLCSNTTQHIRWSLPASLKTLILRNNQLTSFDGNCLAQVANLTELDLRSNRLQVIFPLNFSLPSLVTVRLDANRFPQIPLEFLRLTPQLKELDLSANPMNLKEIKSRQQPIFPTSLRMLHLNGMQSDLSCTLFDSLTNLEHLRLINLTTVRLQTCLFKKLNKLKTLNLSNHHLKTLDESVFRPLLVTQQLEKLDITSQSVRCDACSLRWLLNFLGRQNQTNVACLDQQRKEVSYNTLNFSPCSSGRFLSIILTMALVLLILLLLIVLFIFIDKQRKFQFANFRPVYHMVPLRHGHDHDRVYQDTTEDITNDNVMLVS